MNEDNRLQPSIPITYNQVDTEIINPDIPVMENKDHSLKTKAATED